MNLLDKQTVDTTGGQAVINYPNPDPSAFATLIAEGDFNGATVGVEVRRNGGGADWVPISDAVFTSPDVVLIGGGNYEIKGTVSGASSGGGATSVSLNIVK